MAIVASRSTLRATRIAKARSCVSASRDQSLRPHAQTVHSCSAHTSQHLATRAANTYIYIYICTCWLTPSDPKMSTCRYGLAFWFGGKLTRENSNYDGGTVMNVVFATVIGGFSLGMAVPNLQYLVRGTVAGRRLYAVIDRKPSISANEPGSITPAAPLTGTSRPTVPRVEQVDIGRLAQVIRQSGRSDTYVYTLCMGCGSR